MSFVDDLQAEDMSNIAGTATMCSDVNRVFRIAGYLTDNWNSEFNQLCCGVTIEEGRDNFTFREYISLMTHFTMKKSYLPIVKLFWIKFSK